MESKYHFGLKKNCPTGNTKFGQEQIVKTVKTVKTPAQMFFLNADRSRKNRANVNHLLKNEEKESSLRAK